MALDDYRRVLHEWVETVAQAMTEHEDTNAIGSTMLADGHRYRQQYGGTVAQELSG